MIEINATLFAQIIHFLLLVVVLTWVAYKPITQALADRQTYISSTIDAAEKQQAEAAKMQEEYKALLVQARAEAQSIVDKATKLGEQTREDIIRETKEETAKMLKLAKSEIAREQEKALADLRNEVAALSVLAAGKIIGEKLDAQAHEKLVQNFIGQLDNKGAGGLPC
ncbi:MAG TPA: ATP synthase F0 subunit B [Firmicutes bacterium]|nr:ATP synthase F0 subunit B [Bacillota bacterium]